MVLVLQKMLLNVCASLHLSSIQTVTLVLAQEHLKIHTLIVLVFVSHVLNSLQEMELDWLILVVDHASVRILMYLLKIQVKLHANVQEIRLLSTENVSFVLF
jgi:hypothetical protein